MDLICRTCNFFSLYRTHTQLNLLKINLSFGSSIKTNAYQRFFNQCSQPLHSSIFFFNFDYIFSIAEYLSSPIHSLCLYILYNFLIHDKLHFIQFLYSWQAEFYTISLITTEYTFLYSLDFICVFSNSYVVLRSVCCILPHIHGYSFHQFIVLNIALFTSLI